MTMTTNETWDERIKRENRERAEHDLRMTSIVWEVAKELKATISGEVNGNLYVTTEDGFTFFVSWERYGAKDKTKLSVSGSYHKEGLTDFVRYNESRPSINISATRPAKALARDIERRFLTPYKVLITELRERKSKRDDYENRSLVNARELAAISGGKFQLNTKREYSDGPVTEQPTLRPGPLANFYGNVNVSGDGVSIELRNLTMDQARAVTRALVEVK
jgi:hypothetical protein